MNDDQRTKAIERLNEAIATLDWISSLVDEVPAGELKSMTKIQLVVAQGCCAELAAHLTNGQSQRDAIGAIVRAGVHVPGNAASSERPSADGLNMLIKDPFTGQWK